MVLDGTTIPGDATTTYNGANYCRMLKTGDLYFESYLAGGATYGSFHWTLSSTSVQKLATDQDPLPAGSRVSLRNLYPRGAGDFIGFYARRSGGHLTIFTQNVQSGLTSKVISDGDLVGSVGARVTVSGSVVYVGWGGDVVLAATPTFSQSAWLFRWAAKNGVQVGVGTGPNWTVPGLGSTQFTGLSFPSSLEPPNSDNGSAYVVFKGTYSGGSGLFVFDKSGAISTIAKKGDSAPGVTGATFASFGNALINSVGQVAFSATTSTSVTGIWVVTVGSSPSKVVVAGDAAPGGGTFASFPAVTPSGFNAAGGVAFFATVSGGSGGLFLGTTSSVQAVATTGAAAPSGGNYAFTSASEDVRLNDFSDILFQAPLTGGSADSGLFLKRAVTGNFETVALQGQTAPGTSYPFATIQPTASNYPGEFTALGPSGEVWFSNPLFVVDHYSQGIFRYRLDSTLEKIVVRGDVEPTGLGGTVLAVTSTIGAGRPLRFVFRAAVTDGTAADAFYGRLVAAPDDLTGSGYAGPALFRPSTGTWYIQNLAPVAFGQAGDVPVPADYNGDGLNELAVFRPSTGFLIYNPATPSTPTIVALGQPGDIPAPADYNGDGVTEPAVFRPSTGFLIYNPASPSTPTVIALGQAGDIPVAADYNGDGRAEPAVFRPSTGFLIYNPASPSTPTVIAFGQSGDLPGALPWPDGTAIPSYFRPSTATWAAYNKGSVPFGVTGDIPLVASTGNAANDPALLVYRPGNSTWYGSNPNTSQASSASFGSVGDVPVFELPALQLGYPVTPVSGTLGYAASLTGVAYTSSGLPLWSGMAASGAVLHAAAIATGVQGTPTGTVTFLWYPNQTCGGVGTSVGTLPLDANGLAQPSGTATVTSGGLSFAANYSGDSTYAAGSACVPIAARSTPITFTDDPLASRTTGVKAVHITELRQLIDSIRVAQGLSGYGWTDPTLATGRTGTPVKAVHITDLRTALGAVYAQVARTPPSYTDPTLAAGAIIKAVHIAEIRAVLLTW